MASTNNDLKPRVFNPAGVPLPPPTYSQVAVTPLLPTSRLVTLAGMTGCDPARSDNPKTLLEQVAIAYANIETSLAAAGASPRDIVQVSHDWFCHRVLFRYVPRSPSVMNHEPRSG